MWVTELIDGLQKCWQNMVDMVKTWGRNSGSVDLESSMRGMRSLYQNLKVERSREGCIIGIVVFHWGETAKSVPAEGSWERNTPWSLFLKNSLKRFIFFIWIADFIEGKRHREGLPSAASLSRWPHSQSWAKLKPEFLSSIQVSLGSKGPTMWHILCYFPGTLTGLDWKFTCLDSSQCHKQQLNPQHHHSSVLWIALRQIVDPVLNNVYMQSYP